MQRASSANLEHVMTPPRRAALRGTPRTPEGSRTPVVAHPINFEQ